MSGSSAEEDREREIARFAVLDGRAAAGPTVGSDESSDGGPHRDLESLVALAAELCRAPVAAVDLLSARRRHRVAAVGAPLTEVDLRESLAGVVADDPGIVAVADARQDDRFAHLPAVAGDRGRVRFYASVPLVTQRGITIGRLGVFDDEPRELDVRQARTLRMLAGRVVDVLELRRRSRELEESLAELTRTRDELHRSNKRLAYFAGQVSHDLRTPLTAMMLNIEALAQELPLARDEYVAGLLEAALAAGGRMAAMIEDILSFAQVGGALRMEEVDTEALLAAVRTDLGPAFAAADGELRVEPLPVVVGDEQQLYSVLLNLVSNSVKYVAPGVPPVVDVRAERLEERWRFEVSDNGVGIPDEALAVVFLPFARGDVAAQGEGAAPGHGIGLATAKRVVEAHGGRIGIERRPAGGTTVWFELPD